MSSWLLTLCSSGTNISKVEAAELRVKCLSFFLEKLKVMTFIRQMNVLFWDVRNYIYVKTSFK